MESAQPRLEKRMLKWRTVSALGALARRLICGNPQMRGARRSERPLLIFSRFHLLAGGQEGDGKKKRREKNGCGGVPNFAYVRISANTERVRPRGTPRGTRRATLVGISHAKFRVAVKRERGALRRTAPLHRRRRWRLPAKRAGEARHAFAPASFPISINFKVK